MTIYEHKTTVTASAGSSSTTSLNIRGGLIRYVLIRANTSSTVFRSDLEDSGGTGRYYWGFHTGEIMDNDICLPVSGRYDLNITNASANDTFTVIVSVQEH